MQGVGRVELSCFGPDELLVQNEIRTVRSPYCRSIDDQVSGSPITGCGSWQGSRGIGTVDSGGVCSGAQRGRCNITSRDSGHIHRVGGQDIRNRNPGSPTIGRNDCNSGRSTHLYMIWGEHGHMLGGVCEDDRVEYPEIEVLAQIGVRNDARAEVQLVTRSGSKIQVKFHQEYIVTGGGPHCGKGINCAISAQVGVDSPPGTSRSSRIAGSTVEGLIFRIHQVIGRGGLVVEFDQGRNSRQSHRSERQDKYEY